jgi:TfoX/Sxy family transcriptional regulator of competence genes
VAYDIELASRIRSLLAGEPDISETKMFGGLAFLVRGNMAVSASSQGGLLVRAARERCDELLATGQASPVQMGGRRMTGWLRVPGTSLIAPADLQHWVDIGVTYARTLAPKD